MAEDGIGLARQDARRTRQVGVTDPRGVDLNQNFVRLDCIEIDFAQLELAVELGNDEGGGAAGHCGGGLAVFGLGD